MAVLQLFFPFKALSLCCSPSSLSSHDPSPYYSSLMQPLCNPLSLITQSSLLFSASPPELQESLTRPSRLPDNPIPLLKIPFFPFSRHNMINHSLGPSAIQQRWIVEGPFYFNHPSERHPIFRPSSKALKQTLLVFVHYTLKTAVIQ